MSKYNIQGCQSRRREKSACIPNSIEIDVRILTHNINLYENIQRKTRPL